MQQGRWVSYIFRYRNNVRCENAGFIKVQRITSEYRVISKKMSPQEMHEDTARIQIGMKMYKEYTCNCKIYLMYRQEGNSSPSIDFLEEIHFKAKERDTIVKRFELDWDNPLNNGMSFDCFDGVFFVCDDGEILVGMWNEYAFSPDTVRTAGKRVNKNEAAAEPSEAVGQLEATEENAGMTAEPSEVMEGKTEMVTEPSEAMEGKTEMVTELSEVEEGTEEVTEPSEAVDRQSEAAEENAGMTAGTSEAMEGRTEMVTEPSEAAEENAGMAAGPSGVEEKTEAELEQGNENSENVCQTMLNTFPKLPLLADSQFMECVKIVPHDIGRLAMGNWKLGVNSFLSHGYYHYRYIMMGKVKFERKEAYVIGVPGVYTNKEKYLANMFGFNIFIPAKRTKFLTGNFGYWISEILTE
ncbi:MAG: DUF6128 domain-containing protein [Clostridium sp.]|nr:DUF6128 domain-containing protein [Clostridium sp.]